jgi:hypothetical protein
MFPGDSNYIEINEFVKLGLHCLYDHSLTESHA